MKYTPEEVARLLANRPNQPHYIASMIRRCIDAAIPSAEPVAYQYLYADPFSGTPVWRDRAGTWNGQQPKESRALFLQPSPADEAVRRDAERLDFLDSLNAALNRHYGTDYGWRLILSPNIVRLMSGRHQNGYVGDIDLNDSEGSKHRGKSCRDAIDAAIAQRGEVG